MSYLVLARKYRPKTFTEMVGQEHVVQALTNALTSQRLHHAYLFTGTRGVGKTTVSRILAKSLNCLGADGQGGLTQEAMSIEDEGNLFYISTRDIGPAGFTNADVVFDDLAAGRFTIAPSGAQSLQVGGSAFQPVP